jgi:hypothetical protein
MNVYRTKNGDVININEIRKMSRLVGESLLLGTKVFTKYNYRVYFGTENSMLVKGTLTTFYI